VSHQLLKSQELGSLRLAIARIPVGTVMHRETCPDGQFWLTLTGHWKVVIGRDDDLSGPNDVQFYRPLQAARRVALENSIGFGVQIRPAIFDKPLARWSKVAPEAMSPLRRLLKSFVTGSLSPMVAEEIVADLLAESELSPAGKLKMSRTVAEATDILNEQFRSEIGLTQIASAVQVTPSYLSSAFRSVHGVTLTEYRRDRRLSAVLSAVASQSESLGEACVGAGFYDTSHFFRAFRQTYGFTPAKLNDLFLVES
jgi:AraC-like DNA-binding protein